MMSNPVVELRVTINGEDVCALLADGTAIGPGDADKPLVLAVLAKAFAMLSGVHTVDHIEAGVVAAVKSAPVLSIVKP